MQYLTHHILRSSVRENADKDALIFGPRKLKYADIWQNVCRLSSGLKNSNIKRFDRVGILLSPGLEQATAIFAIAAAGAVFVPIHHSWSAKQVAHVVNDCAMKCLITTNQLWQSLSTSGHPMPSLRTLVSVNEAITDPSREAIDYQQCIESLVDEVQDIGVSKDLAAILYTSGSTGLPKGVMLSHANLLAGTQIVASYLGLSADDRILSVLPFTFDAGLNQLTTALGVGGTLVLTKFLFPREICKVLIEERITGLAGVPTFWGLLAKDKKFHETQFPDLRYITNTGGAMPTSILAKLRGQLPATRVFLMYGLTEAFRSTFLNPDEVDERPTSIGKAIPDTEILVINDKGQECAANEVGELVHDGPTVSLGYWEQPELTASVFRPHPLKPPGRSPDDRVCYSGDLVYKDEKGYLYFQGRRDNLIKTSGYRVSRAEIEDALLQAESVTAAAVVGIPDALLGQRVIAFVVAKEPERFDTANVLAVCAQSLPGYMVPKQCTRLDAMPLTSSGKADYVELQRIAEADDE